MNAPPSPVLPPAPPSNSSERAMDFPVPGRTPPARPSPPERFHPTSPIPTRKFHLNNLHYYHIFLGPCRSRQGPFCLASFRLIFSPYFSLLFFLFRITIAIIPITPAMTTPAIAPVFVIAAVGTPTSLVFTKLISVSLLSVPLAFLLSTV